MVTLAGDIGTHNVSFGRRKNRDITLRVVAAAAEGESAVLVASLGDDIYRAGSGEVAKMDEVRAFVNFDSFNRFWNKPMHVGVALTVRMAYHVYGDAIDENREVGAVIGGECTKQNLIDVAA